MGLFKHAKKVKESLRETLGGTVAEGVDEFFVSMAFKNPIVGRRAARKSVVSRINSSTSFYPDADKRGRLFFKPSLPQYSIKRRKLLGQGEVYDLEWDSGYSGLDASHRRTLARVPRNARCHARWFRHKKRAPLVICIHGWGVGYLSVEEHTFEADRLYRAGMDVVLFTLPFHAKRAPVGRTTPMFPSVDPVRTNEGFAQAIYDLRALLLILKHEKVPSIGVMGMSLGGFTTALLATVETGLDFIVPFISFGSVAEVLWDHLQGSPSLKVLKERGITKSKFTQSLSATTPLLRKPTIDGKRVLVIAGSRDGVIPLRHSMRLREHFVGARFATFPGGHVVQVGRRQAFQEMLSFVGRLGLL